MDDTEASGGFETFIEERLHNQREFREALERIHEGREKVRQRRNASIQRPSGGTRVVTGDFILARESDISPHWQGMGPKLVHEKWTDPWKVVKVVKVVIEGLSVVIEMAGRTTRFRAVSDASLKPFYTRPSDLRYPMEDKLAQMAGGADLGLKGNSTTAAPVYTPLARRRGVSATGVARWEYRGRYLDGVASDWVSRRSPWTASLRCSWTLSREVEHVRSEQRAEPPRSHRRGGEKTPRSE